MPNNNPLELLNAYIKEHKLRHTYERERVLEYILTIDGHFTVQSVHEQMNTEQPIARGSIYNILELFEKIGIIVRHPFPGNEAQYETTARANTHHHRVCISCGAIKEFSDQKFNKAIKNRTFASFEKRFHSIYLYGLCKKCQPKTKKTKNKTNILLQYKPSFLKSSMKQFDHYTSTDKMRDLIQHNNALIMVLARFDIPLGFGEKTVDEICQSHNIDTNTFLEVANFVSNNSFDYTNISVKSLINYLKKAHEYYLEFSLPAIRRKLIEAIDLAHSNEISILIIRLYDEYVNEVKRHMGYENNVVFRYVDNLLQKYLNRNYTISTFAGKHSPIGDRLTQLKDAIICYFPEKNNYLLNDVLLDIMICEQDLASHCKIEDQLFVPAVELEEIKLKNSGKAKYSDDKNKDLSYKEKSDSLSQREKDIIACVAKGMSNKEIADALFLSVHTVTTHRRNIAAKLQIHSPSGITIYAIVNHLIRIEDLK